MSQKQIVHLCLIGSRNKSANWSLGSTWHVGRSPKAIFDLTNQHSGERDADAWVFWDSALDLPDEETILKVLSLPGDLWHTGLNLGLSGQPGLIHFVSPTWTLNRDPDSNKVATSWRLSLRACVIRSAVLQRLGSVCPDYKSLDGASLEMGHRYIKNGAIVRNVPWLLRGESENASTAIPFSDEWLFVYHRIGRKWTYWALIRALCIGYAPVQEIFSAFRQIHQIPSAARPRPFRETAPTNGLDSSNHRVSILIPTLDRYEYLRRLLPQLRNQTVRPLEIIVVDQTPVIRRTTSLAEEYPDLPLNILYQDQPGQCSARNAGLQVVQGDYILFLDDDDEVPPGLIERHLQSLHQYRAPVSCGDVEGVVGADKPEPIRCSDVFPTNNTLIHRQAIESSGLFDLAYNHGERADGDLGMRVYLSGVLMILNPSIRVLHHHAPHGGLRAHGARVVTYGSSRSHLMQRQIPSPTEIYLWKRYFNPLQIRERLLLAVLGTLSLHGGLARKIIKLILGIFFLPHTLWKMRKNIQKADQMLRNFPQIPSLRASENSTKL